MWLLAGIGIAFLAMPVLSLLWRSWNHRAAFTAERTQAVLWDAIVLSLATSIPSMVLILTIGTPLAWILARSQHRWVEALDVLVDLPILLPPAVAGIALLTAFGRMGTIGGWLDSMGVRLGFTTVAVVLAQVFVGAPFFIRSARAGFRRIERDIEEGAADLGASPWGVFWKVTLPMTRSAIVAGAIIAWARALGEFGATIMFAGSMRGVTQTMPLAIYERYGSGDLPAAIVLSVILLGVSAILLATVRWFGEGQT